MASGVAKTASVRTTTAATNLSKLLQDVFMARKFIPFLRKNLVIAQFAEEEDIPAHSGNNVRWLFHNTLSAVTTALSEGDDPADSTATTVNFVQGVLATIGAFIEFTEELEDYAHPETMAQFSELLGEQAARSVDILLQTTAITGSTGLLTTTTSQDAGTACTANAIRLTANKLRKNDALPHPKTPGGKFYATVLSPEQADDMAGEGNPAWWQVKTSYRPENMDDVFPKQGDESPGTGVPRADQEGLFNSIIYCSSNVQADASSPINDQGLMIADNAFGISSFDTNIFKPTVKLVEPIPSLASPLGRRGLYVWKAKFCSQLFDSKRVSIILSDQG